MADQHHRTKRLRTTHHPPTDCRFRPLRFERLEDRHLLSITVNTLVDENNGIGVGGISLRDAIAAAAPAETINFAASLTSGGPASILLTNGQLTISKSLTISGPGANLLTVNAQLASRVFDITAGAFNVDIGGVRLTGGRAPAGQGGGGGIRSQSTALVSIHDSKIDGNGAGGGGTTIGGSGGGISATGPLTVTNCTISGNSAGNGGVTALDFGLNGGSGGGISSSGSLTIANSTINNNSTGFGGDGGLNQGLPGNGGGISVGSSGTTSITNSTISSNISLGRGGGITTSGTPTLRNVTITANVANTSGGGIHNSGALPVTLNHTIVAGNIRGVGRDDINGLAAATFSLIGDNSGATITDNGGNKIGALAAPIDPNLGPLANNGGSTLTHALLAYSPAIDAGDPTAVAGVGGVPLLDQRGNIRVFDSAGPPGAGIDIGAYEAQIQGVSFVVDNPTDESDGNHNPGDLSLREAIALANTETTRFPTINFAASLFSGGPLIMLLDEHTHLSIAGDMRIVGPGSAMLTIDASGNDNTPQSSEGNGTRVFNIDDGINNTVEVTISGLKIAGGDVTGDGGGILSRENLTLNDVGFFGNAATGGGGGIYHVVQDNSLSMLSISNCTVIGNEAEESGGGIMANSFGGTNVGSVNVAQSLIASNSARVAGGGIYNEGTMTIADSTISENSLSPATFGATFGGGIANYGTLAVLRSTISDNVAKIDPPDNGRVEFGGGGGLYNAAEGTLELANSTLSGNMVVLHKRPSLQYFEHVGGGGILNAGSLIASGSTISGNSSDISIFAGNGGFSECGGGGILNESICTLTNCTISANAGMDEGGGIHDNGTLMIFSSTIYGNIAEGLISGSGIGGGISGFIEVLKNSIVANNVGTLGTGNLSGSFAGSHNWIDNLTLGPLQDNGGPTFTHALIPEPNSAVIDKGDPGALPGVDGVPIYDQRGAPYTRVFDGDGVNGSRIDIGAFEYQPAPVGPALPGDYNQNTVVDTADCVVWRNTLNQSVAPYSGADGDGDGVVDQDDYGVWRAHFGQTLPGSGSGSLDATALAEPVPHAAETAHPIAIDAASQSPSLSLVEVAGHSIQPPEVPLIVTPIGRTASNKLSPVLLMPALHRDDALVAWFAGNGERAVIANVEGDETARDRVASEESSVDFDDDSLDAVFAMVGDWNASD